MTTEELVDVLATHRTIGKAPREELFWIASHGTLRRYQAGDIVARPTEVVDGLYFMLSGRLVHRLDRGTGLRKVMEWVGGDVTGVLPYSRLTYPPGESIIEEPAEAVYIPREKLPELISHCHQATSILVNVMTDRARQFTSADLRDEKLVSLGKLAAGLAHELNNPASAAIRDAKSLDEVLNATDGAARALAGAGLTPAQLKELDAVRNLALTSPKVSGLELADKEEAILRWLEDHDIDGVAADELAHTAMTVVALDRLAGTLQGNDLAAALRWVVGGINARALADALNVSAARIYTLVTSVKGFTHMDRAPTTEPVDIKKGLEDTAAILAGKARSKSLAIAFDLDPKTPAIQGVAAEINQIWMNLIDNAIDAAPENGHVQVTAVQETSCVVVRVVDDGSGVPADILGKIFDPFFTTKPVGQGTGLGLDIVRRIVQQHGGEIDVDSKPGRTEFRVKLPVAGRKG